MKEIDLIKLYEDLVIKIKLDRNLSNSKVTKKANVHDHALSKFYYEKSDSVKVYNKLITAYNKLKNKVENG